MSTTALAVEIHAIYYRKSDSLKTCDVTASHAKEWQSQICRYRPALRPIHRWLVPHCDIVPLNLPSLAVKTRYVAVKWRKHYKTPIDLSS
jgi:hypothetical protein